MNVVPAPPSHFQWLARRAGVEITLNFRAIEARDENRHLCPACGLWHGVVRGMVGYSGWTPSSVTMHVALQSPGATRALLGPAFRDAFETYGRLKVFAGIRSDNTRSLRLVERLGFKRQYSFKDGWSKGIDIIAYELLREDWEQREESRYGERWEGRRAAPVERSRRSSV